MHYNKKSQGLSITTIVAAVVALILIVVIITILTGKTGKFKGGLDEAAKCSTSCNALGMSGIVKANPAACTDTILPGSFSDVSGTKVCCCS